MNRRRGVTLVEVLMAIFVMGIGMISLLVLFPIGIFNMQQSIQDNRVGLVSTNAAGLAELWSLRRDDYIVGVPANIPTQATGSMYYLLGAPQGVGVNSVPAPPPNPPPAPFTPGYTMGGSPQNSWWVYQFYPNAPSPPVFVDPVAAYAYGAAQIGYGVFPGGQVNFGVPRSSVSAIETVPSMPPGLRAQLIPQLLHKWFVQQDDIGMDEFGQALLSVNTANAALNNLVERDRTYSHGYIWRRPRFHDPETVDLSIVVFKSRKLVVNSLFEPGDPVYRGPLEPDPSTGSLVFRPVFLPYSPSMDRANMTPPFNAYAKEDQRPNTAVIGWNPTGPSAQSAPVVKRGEWVFDATVVAGLGNYRVAGPGPGGSIVITTPLPAPVQLQVPFTNGPNPTLTLPPEYPPPYFNAHFYRVVGVSEVIEVSPTEHRIQLELDRPVRNVGFAAVFVSGVVDVIEKSDGQKTQATVGP